MTSTSPITAFVLSGGGNQAVAQVGMLRALLEREITPDVIVACSAGGLNGVAIAHSPDVAGAAHLAETWTALSGHDVFPGGKLTRAWKVLRRGDHLFDCDGLNQIINESTDAQFFDELKVPLRLVATDLDTGEEVVFACGPLRPALLASAAIPGVFPIVEHDDRRLVDGAVVNSVPLSHALAGRVDRVFVMNVAGGSGGHPRMRTPLDVVMTSFLHARNQRFERDLHRIPPDVDVTVLPRPFDDRSLLDFSHSAEIIDHAYELSLHALDARAEVQARTG